MNARSPGSFFLSALGHGAIVALVLFFAYASNRIREETPKVMELVAGAGDNYGATEAPALGVPDTIKLKIPVPLPMLPTPPAPEPPLPSVQESPPAPAPVERSPLERAPISKNQALTKPASTAKAKPALRPPNFLRDLKRLMQKREARLEREYKRRLAAESAAAEKAAKYTPIDAEGIKEGVIGGSKENTHGGAEGKALTREDGTLMESYFAFLVQHLKVTFDELKPQDVSESLSASVEFMIAADGSISGGRILRSSGNSAFDRAALECLAHTKPVGPRPDHRSTTQSVTFKMSDDS